MVPAEVSVPAVNKACTQFKQKIILLYVYFFILTQIRERNKEKNERIESLPTKTGVVLLPNDSVAVLTSKEDN